MILEAEEEIQQHYPDLSAPIPDLPIFLDSTMISTFRSCPKKFLWNYIYNLKPAGQSIHLICGGAFAAGLDYARQAQGRHPEGPLPHDILCYEAMKGFMPYVKDWPDDPEHPKNPHNSFYALELYLQQHHPYYDEVQPLRLNDKPATEFSFAIPLNIKHPNGDPFLYVGRFDMLGQYTSNDLLVVFDDKTTSGLGSFWLNQFDLRGQFMGYIWACRKLGYPVKDVVVRGTALLKTEIKFLTVPLSYADHLIERWEQELYYTIEQMIFLHSQNHFPYNFGDSCASFGGCPMLDLCKARNPSQWLTNYKVEEWNPVLNDI